MKKKKFPFQVLLNGSLRYSWLLCRCTPSSMYLPPALNPWMIFRKLPAYALPSKWVLTNFINVFTKSHMLTYFKNSIIVLIGVLVPFTFICADGWICT